MKIVVDGEIPSHVELFVSTCKVCATTFEFTEYEVRWKNSDDYVVVCPFCGYELHSDED